MFGWADDDIFPITEKENLHMMRFYKNQEFKTKDFAESHNQWVAFASLLGNDLLLRDIWQEEGKDLFKQMKDLNIDVYLNDAKDMDNYIAKALDVPTMT